MLHAFETRGTDRVSKVSVSSAVMQSAGHDVEVRTPPDSRFLVVSPNVLIAGLQPGTCSNLGCSRLSARHLTYKARSIQHSSKTKAVQYADFGHCGMFGILEAVFVGCHKPQVLDAYMQSQGIEACFSLFAVSVTKCETLRCLRTTWALRSTHLFAQACWLHCKTCRLVPTGSSHFFNACLICCCRDT